MFNFAIFSKTFNDTLLPLLVAGVNIILFGVFFTWAMVNMGQDLMALAAKWGFLQQLFRMSFGIDISNGVSLEVLLAVCFTHVIVLFLVWGVIVATITRATTGEVEKGTADLLFSLPVSRLQVLNSTGIGWMLPLVILSFCPLIGIAIGGRLFVADEPLNLDKFIPVTVNFLALNLTVAGISCLASALVNRRSLAISIVSGVVLFSIFLNFLSPFLTWLEKLNFLNLLYYFRPTEAVRVGDWPTQQIMTLLLIGVASWIAGAIFFCRKDLTAS